MTAPNGRDAVERFTQDRFDAILMDCEMPVMDGLEATRRIREIESKAAISAGGEPGRARTPIIALTAHVTGEVHVKCTEAGMDDFLVKPFDEQQISDALRQWIAPSEPAVVAAAPNATAAPIDLDAIERIRGMGGKPDEALLERVVRQVR